MDLRKLAASLVSDARAALVSVAVLSVAAFLWAVLGRWLTLPQAVLGSVVVFGSLSVAWNQWRQAFDRDQKKRLASRSPAEIEHWVRDWLFKYKYQNQNDLSPEAHFQIVVTKANDQKLTIALPKAHPFVVIAARLIPDPSEQAKKTNALLLAPDSTFPADLTIQFAQLGVDYRIESGAGPMQVMIERKVTFDETITDLSFAQQFLKVEAAISTVFAIASRVIIAAKTLEAKPLLPTSKRDR